MPKEKPTKPPVRHGFIWAECYLTAGLPVASHTQSGVPGFRWREAVESDTDEVACSSTAAFTVSREGDSQVVVALTKDVHLRDFRKRRVTRR